jgi:hypothetical protein
VYNSLTTTLVETVRKIIARAIVVFQSVPGIAVYSGAVVLMSVGVAVVLMTLITDGKYKNT